MTFSDLQTFPNAAILPNELFASNCNIIDALLSGNAHRPAMSVEGWPVHRGAPETIHRSRFWTQRAAIKSDNVRRAHNANPACSIDRRSAAPRDFRSVSCSTASTTSAAVARSPVARPPSTQRSRYWRSADRRHVTSRRRLRLDRTNHVSPGDWW